MKLVAIKSFTYAGKRVNVGDVFEAKTSRDEKLLIGIKNARALDNRPEKVIPKPPADLVEKISVKLEKEVEPVKEEVAEPVVEPVKEEAVEPIVEPAKEESKPETPTEHISKRKPYTKRK